MRPRRRPWADRAALALLRVWWGGADVVALAVAFLVLGQALAWMHYRPELEASLRINRQLVSLVHDHECALASIRPFVAAVYPQWDWSPAPSVDLEQCWEERR